MTKLIIWCKKNILEMLLAVFSIAIIASFCYGFGWFSAPWAHLLFATGITVLEMAVMWVLNSLFKIPGSSVPFISIYAGSFLLLGISTCWLSIHYLASPWIMMLIMIFGEIFFFLLSLVFVTIQRTRILYRNLAATA